MRSRPSVAWEIIAALRSELLQIESRVAQEF